ncbi:Radical SAM domain protein [Denitrovibrio acetiphilus DSM 12809]|uniref:Radical SAM domain protein n=1 Tax=Denitrovibrio acetiphilus (strain DSM 12809 / NBRC 114555 / N2460) TaxID=522772 RepID=D4H4B5_DENA2|nr:radical SAM protein [Denitrovibrio acetiphilus]ADD69244.1 Radical SAM domain protein [Denitrovibrio acetiphilus DSM 12809]
MRAHTDKYNFLFGPVPSRRLGRSLGVDIIPHKICTLNCIYCEVGRTTECTAERRRFENPDDILAEFRENYPHLKDDLDVVTITGAGEPTLNIDMGYIIKGLKEISEHPVAVLTNSTLLTDKNVQAELMELDVVVPSLDAVSEEAYRRVCAPERSLDIKAINEALVEFSHKFQGKLLVEVLLCEGINDNMEELKKIAGIIKRCRYDVVQLNTVYRPPAFARAKTVPEKTLIDTALYFKSEGINVESVGNYIKELSGGSLNEDQLKRLLTMRPCSAEDIASVFGVEAAIVKEVIDALNSDHLRVSEYNGDKFYFIES